MARSTRQGLRLVAQLAGGDNKVDANAKQHQHQAGPGNQALGAQLVRIAAVGPGVQIKIQDRESCQLPQSHGGTAYALLLRMLHPTGDQWHLCCRPFIAGSAKSTARPYHWSGV